MSLGPADSISALSAAPSLWAATAPAAPDTPALTGATRADVAVVGGGYTGLSVALHLAQMGARVCVLDAHEPGWGASGRNGGQVNPTLKYDPDELISMFGPDKGERLIQAVSTCADLVFGLIDKHGIDCDPVRGGWLQAGYTARSVAALAARARQWQRRGVPVAMLDRAGMASRIGSDSFVGGWWDGRAGSIQPLAYARGLARAAQKAGVRIYGHSPVTALTESNGGWKLTARQGASVHAEQVILATNGYTGGLWPGLSSTVLAANSFIVATQPLGEAGNEILHGGETVATAQRLLLYFRKDAAGRLLMGGRGHFKNPASAADFKHLEQAVKRMFPQLSPVNYEYRWAGRVAITRDHMPHLHRPAPGVTMALGYNGRGVAMATCLGRHAASLVAGGKEDDCPFPVTGLKAFPMHGLQRFYIAAGVAWYSLLDRLGK